MFFLLVPLLILTIAGDEKQSILESFRQFNDSIQLHRYLSYYLLYRPLKLETAGGVSVP